MLREATLARQKELGVIPPEAQLTERPAEIPAWNDILGRDRFRPLRLPLNKSCDQTQGEPLRGAKSAANARISSTYRRDRGSSATSRYAILGFALEASN